MPPELVRTFIAVDVPASVKDGLAAIVDPLRKQYRLNWARPEGMHLTLKFLGDQTPERVRQAAEACQHAAEEAEPFDAALSGWGSFPNPSRPRVIWAGLEDDAAKHVDELFTRVERGLVSAGFDREERSFHPHLTIARVKEPATGAEAFRELSTAELPAESFRVDRITVFRSELDRAGAIYTPQAVCYLG